MRRRIGALLNREDGASMIVVMIVAVGLFMMVPVFLDYASLHYTRRVTQTGADAAALAAAIDYADHFSVDWPNWSSVEGAVAAELCCVNQLCIIDWNTSKLCSAWLYAAYVMIYGNQDSIGDGSADDYAGRNGTEVIDYSASTFSWYEAPRVHIIESFIPIPPVSVDVEVQRRAPMIYGSLYGRNDFYVPARARAEAYLDRYGDGITGCVAICCECCFCICPSIEPTHDYHWKVRLVE